MINELDTTIRLLNEISKSGSLQEISDLAYGLFGNPIFIEDKAHNILAYTQVVEVPDKYWQNNVVEGKFTLNNPRQSKEVKAIHKESQDSGRPVLVHEQETPHPNLVKTLSSGEYTLGVIVLAGVKKPLSPSDAQMLDLLSVFVSAILTRDMNIALPDAKAAGSFLAKLLDGLVFSPEQIKTRLDLLGWKPLKNLYVMVMRPDEGRQDMKGIDTLLVGLSGIPYCRAFLYGEEIVFIFSRKYPVSDWAACEPLIYEMLSGMSVQAGVSRSFHELANIRTHYTEALNALRLGEALKKQHVIHPYHLYSLYYLLEQVPDTTDLRSLCHRKILELEKYDKSNEGELLSTLQVYLEFSRSVSKTADILFIHRNTVQYRINKCMKLMNTNFENVNDIFSFILSLRIIEFEKKTGRARQ